MVEYYESVIHLKISQNRNLGLRAWLAAARMLRRVSVLLVFDFDLCHYNSSFQSQPQANSSFMTKRVVLGNRLDLTRKVSYEKMSMIEK